MTVPPRGEDLVQDGPAAVRRVSPAIGATPVAPAQLAAGLHADGQLAEPRRPGRYQAFQPCENADCRHMLTQHDWNNPGHWLCQAPGCSCLDYVSD